MDWRDDALAARMQKLVMLSDAWDLTELNLLGTSVRDISSLSELTNLECLYWEGCPIEDSALKALEESGVTV